MTWLTYWLHCTTLLTCSIWLKIGMIVHSSISSSLQSCLYLTKHLWNLKAWSISLGANNSKGSLISIVLHFFHQKFVTVTAFLLYRAIMWFSCYVIIKSLWNACCKSNMLITYYRIVWQICLFHIMPCHNNRLMYESYRRCTIIFIL